MRELEINSSHRPTAPPPDQESKISNRPPTSDHPSLRSAVFLDRDGVLIEDNGYIDAPERVKLLPGVAKALKRLKDLGFLLLVVTNQSGVGRGYFTHHDLQSVNDEISRQLALQSVELDGVYSCPHEPSEQCHCRKPNPGLLLNAIGEWSINPRQSYMIGDRESDILAGKDLVKATIAVGNRVDQADINVRDLLSASEWIEKNLHE